MVKCEIVRRREGEREQQHFSHRCLATTHRYLATTTQELRMTIADSDSGITEDVDNTYFNPALYSTVEDDAVSTKSALV